MIAIVLKELEDFIIRRLDRFRQSATGGMGIANGTFVRPFNSLDEAVLAIESDPALALPCCLLSLPVLQYSDLTAANTQSTRADCQFLLVFATNETDPDARAAFYRSAVQLVSSELVEELAGSTEVPSGWAFDHVVPLASEYLNDEQVFAAGTSFKVRIRSNVTCQS